MRQLFHPYVPVALFIISIHFSLRSHSQDSTLLSTAAFSSQYFSTIEKKITSVEHKVDHKTQKALAQLQRREEKMKRKLYKTDSLKAKEVFNDAKATYASLQEKLKDEQALKEYIPYLDTLKTSLAFLNQHQELLAKTKDIEAKLKEATAKVEGLQSSLAKAEKVQQYIKERKAYLQEQLEHLPFTKELKKVNQQAYYYSARLKEYKEVLKDRKKLERKAIELLSKTKAFQSFMRQHAQLASLFRLPGSEPTDRSTLQGLQTRAQVNSLLGERIATAGPNAQSGLQQQVQAAQAQLTRLKDKVLQKGAGSSEAELPDFKPNHQKTKSFLQRIEVGTNLQSQSGRQYFPITSDIGISVGYKLNERSSIGIGSSYKAGLGSGWSNIKLSHQGIGLRSFIDYQVKGAFFISGGYEQNYRSEIKAIEQLKDRSAWQESGLIGLTKKYKISKKSKGSVQLLWDFLSYRQLPKTQPVLFRLGYGLK